MNRKNAAIACATSTAVLAAIGFAAWWAFVRDDEVLGR